MTINKFYMDVDEEESFESIINAIVKNSVDFIGRIDNSPKEYLVMGSRSGRIFRYTGFEGGNVFSAYTRMDSAYSYILSTHSAFTSYMSAPAITDIDGDGKYDMVIGNVYGGLLLFKQALAVDIKEAVVEEDDFLLFPNPAQNEIHIKLQQTISGKNASVIIYNSLGQEMKSVKKDVSGLYLSLDIADLPNAVYYCVVQTEEKRYSSVFVKQN